MEHKNALKVKYIHRGSICLYFLTFNGIDLYWRSTSNRGFTVLNSICKSIFCLYLIESYIKILWLKSFIRKYFATLYLKEMGAPLQKGRIWQNLFSHRQRSRLAPFNNSLINIFTRWFWCVHVNMQMTLKIVRLY